mmetsp:Transcript_36966/g.98483  ORF Transcript_36966/g.98483 Transcript_36966/m.98483 type:complete len:214 (-) Transcript_36966:218-859(-)
MSLKIIPTEASHEESHGHCGCRQPAQRTRELLQVFHLIHDLHHCKLIAKGEFHDARANKKGWNAHFSEWHHVAQWQPGLFDTSVRHCSQRNKHSSDTCHDIYDDESWPGAQRSSCGEERENSTGTDQAPPRQTQVHRVKERTQRLTNTQKIPSERAKNERVLRQRSQVYTTYALAVWSSFHSTADQLRVSSGLPSRTKFHSPQTQCHVRVHQH